MVDKLKIEQAVRLLLEGIGEDITREGLIDTPDRIARMCEEIYGGLGHEADQHLLKQFPVENNEIVLEKDITFYSMCEHHLMPFYGKAHLAYIPNGKVTGYDCILPASVSCNTIERPMLGQGVYRMDKCTKSTSIIFRA